MIHDILPVNNYVGNSSATTFDFDFYIEDSSQLEVYIYDKDEIKTKLTENVDYTIHEVKNVNGSYITFPIAGSSYDILDSDHKLSIMLSLPISQETEYNNSSLLNLNSLEYSLDYLTRLIQIVSRKTDLCVKIDECSSIQPSLLIDTIVEKATNATNAASTTLGYLNSVIDYYTRDYQIYQSMSQYEEKLNSLDTIEASISGILDESFIKADGSTIPSAFYGSLVNSMPSNTKEEFAHLGLPNYSSSNITTFQKTTWFTATCDGWVHYAHQTPSSTHRQFQIKDPNGNIVFYGIVGKTLNTGAFNTIFVFLPKGYSYYAETADIATYDSTTEQYSTTQGAFFIPAY